MTEQEDLEGELASAHTMMARMKSGPTASRIWIAVSFYEQPINLPTSMASRRLRAHGEAAGGPAGRPARGSGVVTGWAESARAAIDAVHFRLPDECPLAERVRGGGRRLSIRRARLLAVQGVAESTQGLPASLRLEAAWPQA